MALMDHPKNVDDLSATKGFQWNFHCDICGSGFKTAFIPSKSANKSRMLGFLGGGASAIGGGLIGGLGGSAIHAGGSVAQQASQFQHMSADWHKEHDNGFMQAVNEAKVHFQKCPKCKRYVCAEDWNGEAGLCTADAPSLVTETQAVKAQTRVDQMREHVKGQTLYDGDSADRMTVCPTCGKPAGAGKFCQNCGGSLAFKTCSKCNKQNAMTAGFCAECGTKL